MNASRARSLKFSTLSLYLFMGMIGAGCSPSDAGRFDRAQMESLVAQVRRQDFSGQRMFFWTNTSGAATLLTGGAKGQEIWAERTADLKLKVVILTEGGNHWGAHGFAFSDAPLSLSPYMGGSMHLDVPGPLKASSVKQQIDAHWWEVYDDES